MYKYNTTWLKNKRNIFHGDNCTLNVFSLSLWLSSLCYLSARTKEVKTLSSFSSRASGLSYSRMMPRFITITRSAFRMVWTRCCVKKAERRQRKAAAL